MTFRDRLRAFELMLERRMPEFQCSVHLCLGQEDVPEAIYRYLRPEDWVFSTHRSHGHYLAKGGEEQKVLDEILGLETGVNGGFSGSQSFADPGLRFHSTAIVGGLVGVATGAALGVSLRTTYDREMVVCCVGDAATEQGVFWESANFAALHRLPIFYVVENNGLSVHAPVRIRQATPLSSRAPAFGLKYLPGLEGLHRGLSRSEAPPAVIEVPCERRCRHVSAMEDLRE